MKTKLLNIFEDHVLPRLQCVLLGVIVILVGVIHPERIVRELDL